MKAIVVWAAVLGIQGALAEEQTEWQTEQEVLAAIDPGKTPKKPQVWHSPRGTAVVVHGDLFGDGRHLALVAWGSPSLVVAKNGSWVKTGELDVFPAWVPPGKTAEEAGYDHIHPPEVPFVLKDLDGDHVPEVLVAFNNDAYRVGYAIARKDGEGIKLMDLRSERGEPEWTGHYLVVTTYDWGRKAWGSGQTYFKWSKGVPIPVATWVDDTSDLDINRSIAVRHDAGGKDRAFEIIHNEGAWVVRSCHWEGGDDTSEEKDFARIQLTVDPAHEDDPGAWRAKKALLFELTTGISGVERRLTLPDGERFDFAKAASWVRVKVEGSEEAKKTLKRISK